MATFDIKTPNGQTYRVQGETPEGAQAALKKYLNAGSMHLTEMSENAIRTGAQVGGEITNGIPNPQKLIGPTQAAAGTLPNLGFQDDTAPLPLTTADNGAVKRGGLLPFSQDAAGNLMFDPMAGLSGDAARAVTLPGDVATGKIDPQSPGAIQRMTGLSALFAPVSAASRAGETAIPGTIRALRPGKAKIPTAEELKAAGSAGFQAARETGVDYSAAGVKSMADGIRQTLESQGIIAELTPKTFSVLSKLQNPPADSIANISGLIAARKALQHAAGDFTNPTEQKAASAAIDALDNFVMGPPAESVVAGPSAAAGKLLDEARGNYAAAMRSDKITGAEERAIDRAGATNSGLNIDNQLRQRIDAILNNAKESRGFSPQEIDFMRQVARGTYGSNAARYVGNLLGGGGGLGSMLTSLLTGTAAGSAAGAPGLGATVGGSLALTGYLSKKASAALTKNQIRQLDELIRMRSPLYQKAMQSQPPQQVLSAMGRSIPLRALLLGGTQQPAMFGGQQ